MKSGKTLWLYIWKNTDTQLRKCSILCNGGAKLLHFLSQGLPSSVSIGVGLLDDSMLFLYLLSAFIEINFITIISHNHCWHMGKKELSFTWRKDSRVVTPDRNTPSLHAELTVNAESSFTYFCRLLAVVYQNIWLIQEAPGVTFANIEFY